MRCILMELGAIRRSFGNSYSGKVRLTSAAGWQPVEDDENSRSRLESRLQPRLAAYESGEDTRMGLG